jgi:CHAT domain-containing protein
MKSSPEDHRQLLLGADAPKEWFASARHEVGSLRVLAVATHAIIAGEVPGLVEPAIVLTPGDETTAPGLLLGSEIAAIDLNIDLVILSACNTAAHGRGRISLARAFLYPGARSLLVSN